MKVEIGLLGYMFVEAETSTESYALKSWYLQNYKILKDLDDIVFLDSDSAEIKDELEEFEKNTALKEGELKRRMRTAFVGLWNMKNLNDVQSFKNKVDELIDSLKHSVE